MRRNIIAIVGALLGSSLAAIPAGASASLAPDVQHVVLINLENEGFSAAFGKNSEATYLNRTLVPQGVLITHYFGTAHFSLPNYIAQVSGQAPTATTQADCGGAFANVKSGALLTGPTSYGQVKGKSGCVYPSGALTIADQLDAISPPDPATHTASWRAYQEDMGNDAVRDGGATCAHPAIDAPNTTNYASKTDGYSARHNPFVWFHSVIDRGSVCRANVVALGNLDRSGHPKATSPLVNDLASVTTTPAFSVITPSLCNDGHDEVCTSKSAAGGSIGGLRAADAWLQAWVPTLTSSPAFVAGSMLIVITFDEASIAAKSPGAACCSEPSGPNVTSAGLGFGPGGGRVGALLLGPSSAIVAGSKDTVGRYNHYSLLRTMEDLLGITTGGSDGAGHLGMAGAPGVSSFGPDVFAASSP